MNLAKRRPAETTTGLAGAVALITMKLTGTDDPAIYGALIVIISAIPMGVTWLADTLGYCPRNTGEDDSMRG